MAKLRWATQDWARATLQVGWGCLGSQDWGSQDLEMEKVS